MSETLTEITGIEGLKPGVYQEAALQNDTPPSAIMVKFEAVSEDMPFLTNSPENKSGMPIKKTFVYRRLIKPGYEGRRRIKDSVEYNVDAGKWEICRLAPEGKSDIVRHKAEWNAFMRGVSVESLGTNLELLFRADPARVDLYRGKGIHSIEVLSGLTEGDFDSLQIMGCRADRERARVFLLKAKEMAPSLQLQQKIDVISGENDVLKRQNEELLKRLESLEQKSIERHEVKIPRKRRTKKEMEEASEAA